MSLLFLVSIIIFSLFISFQDFKERKVSVWVLIGFSVLLCSEAFWSLPLKQVLAQVFLNVCFLLIQFALVFLYYYVRYKGTKKLMSSFGGADIWVLVSLVIAFALPNFMIFMIFSLVLSMLTYLIYRTISANSSGYIPLAGFISLIYCISRIIMYFYSPLLQWDDGWVQEIMGQ
ncbi:MAG TPA: hypothetical protein VNY73_08310 [Bacteroidia bacterium]|nr:hypothetical protein [Bacteroidia bacterium]